MPYFHIMSGLRGCYMPDSSTVIQCSTRRELKRALQWEAESQGEAWGLSKRALSWAAAKAWRERKGRHSQLAILPYGNEREARPYSIEIHGASRADWLAQQD